MFPSMNAKPGQRVQVEPCAHCEQPDKSFKPNRANFFQLFGVAPDVDEALLPHVAARQGKLHTRIKFSVGRNVTGSMARAARQGSEALGIGRGRRCAKFFGVADKHFVAKKFAEGWLAGV